MRVRGTHRMMNLVLVVRLGAEDDWMPWKRPGEGRDIPSLHGWCLNYRRSIEDSDCYSISALLGNLD